jgi:hypothetical protein
MPHDGLVLADSMAVWTLVFQALGVTATMVGVAIACRALGSWRKQAKAQILKEQSNGICSAAEELAYAIRLARFESVTREEQGTYRPALDPQDARRGDSWWHAYTIRSVEVHTRQRFLKSAMFRAQAVAKARSAPAVAELNEIWKDVAGGWLAWVDGMNNGISNHTPDMTSQIDRALELREDDAINQRLDKCIKKLRRELNRADG